MKGFESQIGYLYKDKALLSLALTHSSYANESKKNKSHNERLEFLGDSVLSIIVSKYLFQNYPDMPEGELSKTRAALVCEKSLAGFAREIGLGSMLLLGRGEDQNGGRNRDSILADAFEALIASMYLDGGISPAEKFVLGFIKKQMKNKQFVSSFTDYKTELQEIIQQNKEEKVEYVLVEESGPAHDKFFCVEVHLNSNVIGRGEGKSKKIAEQMAAKEALELMGE
ncbi:MAG: ribonuclease III [Ruminococcaceae bacterium]|nr:ribonuclease III [Oscillospiraceae bacterium]